MHASDVRTLPRICSMSSSTSASGMSRHSHSASTGTWQQTLPTPRASNMPRRAGGTVSARSEYPGDATSAHPPTALGPCAYTASAPAPYRHCPADSILFIAPREWPGPTSSRAHELPRDGRPRGAAHFHHHTISVLIQIHNNSVRTDRSCADRQSAVERRFITS